MLSPTGRQRLEGNVQRNRRRSAATIGRAPGTRRQLHRKDSNDAKGGETGSAAREHKCARCDHEGEGAPRNAVAS